MDTFLANITTFPVVVFTFLMIIVCFYWLIALLGVIDIDMFELDMDVETDFETEVSINPDAQGLSGLAGFILNWGLTGVPITVVISLLIITSWLISYLATSLILVYIPFDIVRYVAGAALIFVCFALSIPITAWTIRPLKGLFIAHTAVKKESLVGQKCEVKTGKVTDDFGQAILEDGEAGMILDVRAPNDKQIKKGDKVILIEYIKKDNCYNVAKI
jgi:hypothetical protein